MTGFFVFIIQLMLVKPILERLNNRLQNILVLGNDASVRYLLSHIKEYPGLPPSVMLTITSWNRGRNPENKGEGLTDERIDEIIMGEYGEKLTL